MPVEKSRYRETLPQELREVEDFFDYLERLGMGLWRAGAVRVVFGEPEACGGQIISQVVELPGVSQPVHAYNCGGVFVYRWPGHITMEYLNKWGFDKDRYRYYNNINRVPPLYFVYKKRGCVDWWTCSADRKVVFGQTELPKEL